MTKLQQLREERGKIKQSMEALLDGATKDERRDLNEDESKRWDELEAEYEKISASIQREERLQDIDSETSESAPEDRNVRIVHDSGNNNQQSTNRFGRRSYRAMFGGEENTLSNSGFKNFREFLTAVHSGVPDERLQFRSMSEGVGSEGGFLVPPEFTAEILDQGLESEIMRPRCQVWPMLTNEKIAPGWDGADHSSTLYGGFSGQWLAEGETATVTDKGKFRSIKLKAKKLAIFTSASNELVSDVMSFEEMLNGALSKALSWFLDYACLNGTGAGQPLGMFNCPSVVEVAKESGQSADTILWENICEMFARIHPNCRENAIWIANDTIIPQLLTMTITVGTGGSHINQMHTAPVLREDSGKFFLLGKEVFFTEKVPVLGDKGDITLIDPTQYVLGLRKELLIEKNSGVHWSSDKTAYRAILRGDGMGMWNEAVTPKNGNSLSWAVTLAERA